MEGALGGRREVWKLWKGSEDLQTVSAGDLGARRCEGWEDGGLEAAGGGVGFWHQRQGSAQDMGHMR